MREERAERRQALLLALMKEYSDVSHAMEIAHKLSAFVEDEHLAGATADAILVFDQWDNLLGTVEQVGENAKELEVRNMRLLLEKIAGGRNTPRWDLRGLMFKVVSYREGCITTWEGVGYDSGDVVTQSRLLWIKDGRFSIPPEARRTETKA